MTGFGVLLRCSMALLVTLGMGCGGEKPGPKIPHGDEDRPNIVLIVVDSLRSDYVLGSQGGAWLTPRLGDLARRGTLFPNVVTQSGWTLPAVYSLLSGRHPPPVEITVGEMPALPKEQRLLPEILGYYGYQTAVFWGQTLPGVFPDFSRGFGMVGQAEARHSDPYRDPVTEWIGGSAKEPFFLMVHNLDLHTPGSIPSPEVIHTFDPTPTDCPGVGSLDYLYHGLMQGYGPMLARSHVLSHYAGMLKYYDSVVGDLALALEQRGVLGRTVFLFTSNHGEDLFDHGFLGHGRQHYESVLRIPLLVIDPRLKQTGMLTSNAVQTIDIAPTLLARAGIPKDQGMAGVSFLPLLGQGEGVYTDREAYSLTSVSSSSLRTDRYKLIRYTEDLRDLGGALVWSRPYSEGKMLLTELYDLIQDPQETQNIVVAQRSIATALDTRLTHWLEERKAEAGGMMRQGVTDRMRQFLQERGYWGIVEGGGNSSTPQGAIPADDRPAAGPRQ